VAPSLKLEVSLFPFPTCTCFDVCYSYLLSVIGFLSPALSHLLLFRTASDDAILNKIGSAMLEEAQAAVKQIASSKLGA
jgi:hypothetical protein